MFDKLKSMIYEDPAAPPTAKPTLPAVGGNAITPAAFQSVSPEFVSAIRKVVMSRNTALTQLVGAAEKLVDIIPDPTTRLKAAFKMAADGRTVQQVAAAVDIHLADVESEERRFAAAIEQKVKAEVGALDQQVVAATTLVQMAQEQITAAQTRIAELTERIAQAQTQGAEAQAAANTKRVEIEQAQHQFKAAAESVRAELNNQKSAILSALT